MRCRIRRRRNRVVYVSCPLLLIVIVSATYIPVYIQVAALVQSVNFTTSTDVQTGFEHRTTELFGKYFVSCVVVPVYGSICCSVWLHTLCSKKSDGISYQN